MMCIADKKMKNETQALKASLLDTTFRGEL